MIKSIELVHFKRIGYGKVIQFVYNNFVIKTIGYNPKKKSNVNVVGEILKDYNNGVSKVVKKQIWEFEKVTSLKEVIPTIESFINENLKKYEKEVRIENFIESYSPCINLNMLDKPGYSYLKEDKNMMSVVFKNGEIATIDTDICKGKDINIFKTFDIFYDDKAILPIKEQLLNPSPKLLNSSLTEIYLCIHENNYKKNMQKIFKDWFQYEDLKELER